VVLVATMTPSEHTKDFGADRIFALVLNARVLRCRQRCTAHKALNKRILHPQYFDSLRDIKLGLANIYDP